MQPLGKKNEYFLCFIILAVQKRLRKRWPCSIYKYKHTAGTKGTCSHDQQDYSNRSTWYQFTEKTPLIPSKTQRLSGTIMSSLALVYKAFEPQTTGPLGKEGWLSKTIVFDISKLFCLRTTHEIFHQYVIIVWKPVKQVRGAFHTLCTWLKVKWIFKLPMQAPGNIKIQVCI